MKYHSAWTNSNSDPKVFAKGLEVEKLYVEKKVQEQVDATVDELVRKTFGSKKSMKVKPSAGESVPLRDPLSKSVGHQVQVVDPVPNGWNTVQLVLSALSALLFYFCISLMRRVQTLETLVAWQQTVETLK